MRSKIFLFILLSVSLFMAPVYAETTIRAQVNKTRITTDEPLIYKVVVSSDEKMLPALELPKFEGFAQVSKSQSSSISLTAGKITTKLSYDFILASLKPGKITIGPSQIKIKDQFFKSESFDIEVTQGKNKPKIPPQNKLQSPQNIPFDSEESKVTL